MAVLNLSCEKPESIELRRGLKKVESSEFAESFKHFDRAISRNQMGEVGIIAAREGAKIAYYELKNFEKAIDYFRHLVLYSTDIKERISAQQHIAQIYFDNLAEYDKAIIEYSKLLSMPRSISEEFKYKLNVARAYFYQGNLFQSDSEAQELLRKNITSDQRFDILLLRANIKLSQKNHKIAAELFSQLIEENPSRAFKEDVHLSLALCLEEGGDYLRAIETLSNIRDQFANPEYIEVRLKRIKERQLNQPGSRGRIRK